MPHTFELDRIYLMDAIEGLKKIPDNSVNLILCDPPYNLDFTKYDNLKDKTGRRFHYTEKLEWNTYDLKASSVILFKEFDRILKEDGSVIIFGPQPFKGAHFAIFPEELIETPIKTTRKNALIMDIFCGSGTSCKVARDLGRDSIGIEINPKYVEIIKKRLFGNNIPLFLDGFMIIK